MQGTIRRNLRKYGCQSDMVGDWAQQCITFETNVRMNNLNDVGDEGHCQMEVTLYIFAEAGHVTDLHVLSSNFY